MSITSQSKRELQRRRVETFLSGHDRTVHAQLKRAVCADHATSITRATARRRVSRFQLPRGPSLQSFNRMQSRLRAGPSPSLISFPSGPACMWCPHSPVVKGLRPRSELNVQGLVNLRAGMYAYTPCETRSWLRAARRPAHAWSIAQSHSENQSKNSISMILPCDGDARTVSLPRATVQLCEVLRPRPRLRAGYRKSCPGARKEKRSLPFMRRTRQRK